MFIYEISCNVREKAVKVEKFEAREDGEHILVNLDCGENCEEICIHKDDFEVVTIAPQIAYMYSFNNDTRRFVNMVKKQLADDLKRVEDSIYMLKLKESSLNKFLRKIEKY